MFRRVLKVGLLLVLSWCAMTMTHEAGHLIGGWTSGGTLKDADLCPWHLPYSIFEPNPNPLLTLWAGPILGVAVPLLAASLIRRSEGWFVGWFCCLANGLYLAIAWWSGEQYLDTTQLLNHGAHPVSIAAYCALTISTGYVGFRKSVLMVLAGSQAKVNEPTEI